MLQHGTETEMEAKARKWKGNWSRGICIFVAPTPDTKPSTLYLPPFTLQPETELTFLTMKMKICASCYLLRLQFRCSFFVQTKKYVGCASVCVCGFVKSASVISVRLNGAKQTWAKNSDRKRPQRGPKKCSSWTCFMWVLCRAKERQKERVGTRDKAIYIFAVRESERGWVGDIAKLHLNRFFARFFQLQLSRLIQMTGVLFTTIFCTASSSTYASLLVFFFCSLFLMYFMHAYFLWPAPMTYAWYDARLSPHRGLGEI